MQLRIGPHGTGAVVNVPMSPLGSLAGRVLARARDGQLVPLPVVRLHSPALGDFTLPTDDGQFTVEVSRFWEGAPLFVMGNGLAPHATTFTLTEPVTVDLGEIVLTPGRPVHGRVVDASGAAVEGAEVHVGYAKGTLPDLVAVTGPTGLFRLEGVSEGATPLTVTHPAFRPQEVVLAPGADGISVRLAAALSLPVRVMDVDGAPIAGARVWNVISTTECETDGSGACTLTGLERKEQVLEVSTVDGPRRRVHQLRVPIVSAAPGPVSVRLPRQASTLRIIPTEGGGFSEAVVRVVPGEVAPERAMGAEGELLVPYHATGIDLEKRITNLPPGRYTIFAVSRAGGLRCAVRVVDLAEGADERVLVELPRAPGPCRP